MKQLAALFVLTLIAGCATQGLQGMDEKQIKALAGTAACSVGKTLYGSASTILASTDDTRKGATSKGKTVITCGDASMTIETDVGVAKP